MAFFLITEGGTLLLDVGTLLAIGGIVALILLMHSEGILAIAPVGTKVALSRSGGRMVSRTRIQGGTLL